MTREFNYDAIISFAVFADKLNFTRAAEQLHISQPALHMKIQELTAALGVRFIARTEDNWNLQNRENALHDLLEILIHERNHFCTN